MKSRKSKVKVDEDTKDYELPTAKGGLGVTGFHTSKAHSEKELDDLNMTNEEATRDDQLPKSTGGVAKWRSH